MVRTFEEEGRGLTREQETERRIGKTAWTRESQFKEADTPILFESRETQATRREEQEKWGRTEREVNRRIEIEDVAHF